MMIIPAKYHHFTVGFLMALLMSCIMSLVISLINLGWVDNILSVWMHAWFMAFIVAFPVILVVGPLVRKMVTWIVKHP